MSKYSDIFTWLLTCPAFADNLSFGSGEVKGESNVIVPFGTSARRNISDYIDVDGYYNGSITPLPSVYEEYQVQCFRIINANENEYNIMTLDEVQSVCDWVIEQDEIGNFPQIEGKRVIAVEPFPFNPQSAGYDYETGISMWYFTLRITYQGTAKGRSLDEC